MKKLSTYEETKKRAIDDAARWLASHTMRDGLVRSFRFHGLYTDRKLIFDNEHPYPFGRVRPPVEGAKFAYRSDYHFTLTWTPGQLVLTGDIGELTLTHYHALANFESGIHWALSSDFDYLLGKSDKRRQYDADDTLRQLKRSCYEEIVQDVWGYVSSSYVRDPATGKHVEQRRRRAGAIDDLRAWRRDKTENGANDDRDEKAWREDRPRIWYVDTKPRFQSYRNDFDPRIHDLDEAWDFPPSWHRIIRVWQYLHRHTHPADQDEHPSALLTRKGRAEFWHEVESHLENESTAADLHYAVFEDAETSRSWSQHNMFQIAAIQHGCRMIVAELGLKERAAA